MRIRHTLLIAVAMGLAACDWYGDPKVVGEGPVVTSERTVTDFSQIAVTGIADVIVTVGGEPGVTLRGQENIFDVMSVSVSGSTLKLEFDDHVDVQTDEPLEFIVSAPQLTSISAAGTGEMTLSGDAQSSLSVTLAGVIDLRAYDLEVASVGMTLSGTNDAWVYATESLNVTIAGEGNVYFRGSPTTSLTVSGAGVIVDDN